MVLRRIYDWCIGAAGKPHASWIMGALSFGAVYPWAFVPLFALSALVGTAALLERARTSRFEALLSVCLSALKSSNLLSSCEEILTTDGYR